MINRIGDTAGKIFNVLQNGPLSLNKLIKETNREEKITLMALGWLSREDKIEFVQNGKQLTISLKN
jgi:hypothetical protein